MPNDTFEEGEGRVRMHAAIPAQQPRTSPSRASLPLRSRSAARSDSAQRAGMASQRSFLIAASMDQLTGAVEQHEQRMDDGSRVGRAAGKVDIDRQKAV